MLKTPKPGDFRVQHYLGRGIEPREAPINLRRTAADCLYARVDAVEVDGQFLLMEFELIEPFLYLDTALNSFARSEAEVKRLARQFEAK